jgi:hypothetical protein
MLSRMTWESSDYAHTPLLHLVVGDKMFVAAGWDCLIVPKPLGVDFSHYSKLRPRT